jgi:hypothetical protein
MAGCNRPGKTPGKIFDETPTCGYNAAHDENVLRPAPSSVVFPPCLTGAQGRLVFSNTKRT